MPGFNDRFGGSSIQPTDVEYREVALTGNQVTEWPAFATGPNVLARLMEVNPTQVDWLLQLPDAREASLGMDVLFRNVGNWAFYITNADGVNIYQILPGQAVILYLTENSTKGGEWGSFLLGVGTATIDLLGAAGNGLIVVGNRLVVSPLTSAIAGNTTLGGTDRAKLILWTGGTGTLTLPLVTSIGQFATEIRNQGSGTLTLQASGINLIDSSTAIVLQIGESCWLHASETTNSWYTVGRGRSTQFAFNQLQKVVTGGVVPLTLTEAANVVQTYTGTLTANVDIVLPSVVQVYYVSNQTSGPFTLRLKNAGSGTTVPLPTGQNAVIFSDGTNVINASTTVAGLSSLVLAAGSAPSPSLGVGATNSGIFSSGTNEVAISSNGAKVATFGPTGLAVAGMLSAVAAAGGAINLVSRPAGQTGVYAYQTNGVDRWRMGVSATAEGGSNSGSDWSLGRYTDAGALIDEPIKVNRATGLVTITNLLISTGIRDPNGVGRIEEFAGPPSARPSCVLADGALLSRTAYPELYAFALAGGLVTEAQWSGGRQGCFSVGNGTTTFRIPDLRGIFRRGQDNGRGIDPSREWGSYQDHDNVIHTHGVYDPQHQHGGSTIAAGDHNHGVNDPGHEHLYGYVGGAGVSYAGVGGNPSPQSRTTGNAVTGIWLNNSGNHAHNIVSDFRSTGISLYNQGGSDGRPRNTAYPVYIRYQ